MKAEIKIPKGWRRLPGNWWVKYGDRYLDHDQWVTAADYGRRVGSWVYIRRIKPKKQESERQE